MKRAVGLVPVLALLGAVITGPPSLAESRHLDIPAFPVSSTWAFKGQYPIDPPADFLVDVPEVGTSALLAKAGQTTSVCSAYELFDQTTSPRPDRITELYNYAQQYVNITQTIDPRSVVKDPTSTDPKAHQTMPTFLDTAFQLERQDMFAYAARLQYTATLYNKGFISTADVDKRVNLALVQLTASGFNTVDAVAVRARTVYC